MLKRREAKKQYQYYFIINFTLPTENEKHTKIYTVIYINGTLYVRIIYNSSNIYTFKCDNQKRFG